MTIRLSAAAQLDYCSLESELLMVGTVHQKRDPNSWRTAL